MRLKIMCTQLMRKSTALMIFGVLASLLTAVPLAIRFAKQVPLGVVVSCEKRHSHIYYFELTLDGGSTVTMTSQELPERRDCIPPGSTLEKRRWQWGWTVNGSYVVPDRTSLVAASLIAYGALKMN